MQCKALTETMKSVKTYSKNQSGFAFKAYLDLEVSASERIFCSLGLKIGVHFCLKVVSS